MSKPIYTVALVEEPVQGYVTALYWNENKDKAFKDDEYAYYKKKCIGEILAYYGSGKCLFYLQTTDRGAMLSARIKCECAELRAMVEHHNRLLTVRDNRIIQDEVYDLCCEVQNAHIMRIGRLVNRYMTRVSRDLEKYHRPIEELAMQCYDVYFADREAKALSARMSEKLNNKYKRNLANSVC